MPAGQSSNPAQRTTFRPPWIKENVDMNASPGNKFNMELRHTKKRDSTSSSDSSDGGSNVIAKQLASLRQVEPKEGDDRSSASPERETSRETSAVLEQVQLRKVGERKPYDRESFRKEKEKNPIAGVKLKKTTVKTKEPQKNGDEKEVFFQKPALKPVPVREKTPPKKDHKLQDLPTLKKVEERKLPDKPVKLAEDIEIDRELPAKRNSLVRGESMRRLSTNGPAPPPMPPPPPGMPGQGPQKPITEAQRKRLENLKARPKVRPDWSQTLKEIESGKKLRHVECNDRSQPLLPEAKAQEHFVFDSEKPNVHNELLKQIETGFKLKKVQTNDRSKPMLEGLRKFRRQMTIEEQIQKSMSMASIPPEEITPDEVDEMDDIDKVRDDLQSTKQMLALELRNKEAQQMENKRLLARLANLEAELEKAKAGGGGGGGGGSATDDKIDRKGTKDESEEIDWWADIPEIDTNNNLNGSNLKSDVSEENDWWADSPDIDSKIVPKGSSEAHQETDWWENSPEIETNNNLNGSNLKSDVSEETDWWVDSSNIDPKIVPKGSLDAHEENDWWENSPEDVIQSLKKEAEQSRKNSEQMENKYTEAMKELDTTKLKMEEYKRKTIELEKKLQDALSVYQYFDDTYIPPRSKTNFWVNLSMPSQASKLQQEQAKMYNASPAYYDGKRVSFSERQNSQVNGDNEEDIEEDESEEESDGEDNPEKREKKLQKEVKQLANKLRNFKVKEDNAKKERIALKEIIKKHHVAMKDEKKKYNKIKKEVDKMASLLKDTSEDEDDDEEKEEKEEDNEEEEEAEEEESSEEESESETDESDSELSQSEPEDAPVDKKKTNLSSRVKRHENRVNALKKGNYLLKTNAERLQDDLNKQKEMTDSLQHDLDSVLSELG